MKSIISIQSTFLERIQIFSVLHKFPIKYLSSSVAKLTEKEFFILFFSWQREENRWGRNAKIDTDRFAYRCASYLDLLLESIWWRMKLHSTHFEKSIEIQIPTFCYYFNECRGFHIDKKLLSNVGWWIQSVRCKIFTTNWRLNVIFFTLFFLSFWGCARSTLWIISMFFV